MSPDAAMSSANALLIHIEPSDKGESLQSQIRRQFVDNILSGALPGGRKLPSSRKLAMQLRVSRNTVVLVYNSLLEEGFLVSRERSGIYVNDQLKASKPEKISTPLRPSAGSALRLPGRFQGTSHHSLARNWRDYRYPFVDGVFDISLYPVRELKDANARANASSEILQWSQLQHDCDDPMLVEQIQTRILPRRGISASANEILITAGSQQALYLLMQLLVDGDTQVAMEEPGFPEARELIRQRTDKLRYQHLDLQGMVVDHNLDGCHLIYTTPSHQTPTSVTMSLSRRQALLQKATQQDSLILEDDFEFESNFLGQPHPALRSLEGGHRVVYLSCLSKVLAAGLQISFVVAEAEVIAELRKLRKLVGRTPSLNNQRTAAYFLSLGYYDAFMMQVHKTIYERWLTLREALNIYLPNSINTGPIFGGSAYWITGPKELDDSYLLDAAAKQGILLEPVRKYFAAGDAPKNCFRMGVTSISADRIKEGVRRLAQLIRELVADHEENLSNAKGRLLSQAELEKRLPGMTLCCEMVYGVPCEIRLLADGRMQGETGGYNPEADTGRWWVKDGMYYRQWQLWGYGETHGYYVIVDGTQMKWFDADYRLVRKLEIV
ncbi:PLP-dependent aminotransferase family protein [Aliiglaciecola sp. CAU 1673]|uniref:aminotransferase-like domain-containing protein n=1 Tax=Aliiglaciecola sp. CAU 1673 TaxID=3032595 RepID=UPI0023DA15FF|nr:PLP-dependent aminotransferase family protein [Aliiglaciecola sp. CAU 1673]MDF2179039.1 PLP-dependent aminotransferase family protein [Aliiglaciecola sp. CAU 1673]